MDIGNLLRKRLGPLTLRGWLSLFLAALVGNVILTYVQPSKTNRTYLQELIESGTVEKTAIDLVAAIKKADNARTATEAEWKQIEKGLSECVVREANKYVASNDPYLEAKADKTTPHILAKRFLRACGVTN